MEESGLGQDFWVSSFCTNLLLTITCELWIGRLADVPIFSRVEREEKIWMKVKVWLFKLFLVFLIIVSA